MAATVTRTLDRVLDTARDGTAYGLPLASGLDLIRRERR
jgi:hypothetical protein